jgi:entericidin A
MMKKSLAATALVALMLLAACNTVKGVGRDIESVGQAGSEAIN